MSKSGALRRWLAAVVEGVRAQPSRHPRLPCVRAPGDHSASSGFTLIEVVIAFIVAALVIAVTASALITTLRAEAMAHRQRQADAALHTLQAGLWLEVETNSLATNLPPDWALESESVEQGEGSNRVDWMVWRMSPLTRSSFSAALATPQPAP